MYLLTGLSYKKVRVPKSTLQPTLLFLLPCPKKVLHRSGRIPSESFFGTIFFFILSAMLLLGNTAFSATISAIANGNWTAAGTWGGGVPPGASDVANINTYSVTVNTTTAVCTTVELGNTADGYLIFNSGAELRVSGNVVVGGGGPDQGYLNFTSGGYLKCATMTNFAGGVTYGTGTVEFTGTIPDLSFQDWYNVILSGTANVTLAVVTRFWGNLTLGAGTTLVQDGSYMYLYQNWTINATATFTVNDAANAYVVPSGAATQYFYGSFSCYKFWPNKTSDNPVYIDGTITITNTLFWSRGIFIATGSGKFIINDGVAAGGGTPAGNACIAAPINKIGDDVWTFPLCSGDGTNYAPLIISDPGTTTTETITATYSKTNPTASGYTTTSLNANIDHVSIAEFWKLERTGGTANITIKIPWGAWSGGVDDYANLTVAQWNGAEWGDVGPSTNTGNNSAGTATSTAVATYYNPGPFTLGSQNSLNPLPVELLSFKAKSINDAVDVSWTTASEKNCDYFSVEKSKQGDSFNEAARVNGGGNSSTILSYRETDNEPYSGTSYYRLKQVDFNGAFTYSHIVAVEFNSSTNALHIYPTLSSGEFSISYNGEKNGSLLVFIRNILGQEYYSKGFIFDTGEFIESVNLSGELPAGMYTVTASSDDRVCNQKIVIK